MVAVAAAAKSHPRMLPTGSSFDSIAAAARAGDYRLPFDAFLSQTNALLSQAVAAPPSNLTITNFPSKMAYSNWLVSLSLQGATERRAIEALGYGYRFSKDSKLAASGIDRMLALAAWPAEGATSEAINDQANREIFQGLAAGLDLFNEMLTPIQRATVVSAMRARIGQTMATLKSLDTWPNDSHLLETTPAAMQALLLVTGMEGFPEAPAWLAQAWDTFVTTRVAWGGADGGWGNSNAYGWYLMTRLPVVLGTARIVANADLSRWPVIGRLGNAQIALTAPGTALRSAFGDASELTYLYEAYSSNGYRLYSALTRDPGQDWYWRVGNKPSALAAALPPAHYMLLGLSPRTVVPAAPTQASWLFEHAGIAAMHSSTADPQRSSVFFRSSPLGSFNHSHADNNSFTFVSKGRDILISGGYYPYYGSPHHTLVARATRFKNALTFDGGIGQAEPNTNPTAPGAPVFSMDARGEIIIFSDNGKWSVVTGDATLAYRSRDATTKNWLPLLSNAVRTVAYDRTQGIVVIYDWATSVINRRWELNFQSPTQVPAPSSGTVQFTNGTASACVDVYGLPNTIALTRGFPVAPENGSPDQYQVRYRANTATTQLVAVTVIRESCRAVPISVTLVGTSASVSINGGAQLTLDRRTVAVPATAAQ
jgi:hypothetical protein